MITSSSRSLLFLPARPNALCTVRFEFDLDDLWILLEWHFVDLAAKVVTQRRYQLQLLILNSVGNVTIGSNTEMIRVSIREYCAIRMDNL